MAKAKPLPFSPEPAVAPRPYKALAMRQVGRSWQLVTLTIQGSVVISEEVGEPTMFPIAVADYKVAAARYFAEVVQ